MQKKIEGFVTAWIMSVVVFMVCLFMDFMPGVFGTYSDQRFTLVLLVIIIFCSFVVFSIQYENVSARFSRLSPFIFLVLSFMLTAAFGSSGKYYLVEPIFYTLYFLSIGILGNYFWEKGRVTEVAIAFVVVLTVACFFYGAMTLNVYLFAVTDDFSKLDNIIPWGFVSIRYWSHIATWVILLLPLAVFLGPFKRNKLWRWAVALTGGLWWWMIILSASRGSALGLLAGLVGSGLLFGRQAIPWVMLCLRYLILGAIIWLILSVLVPSMVFDDLQVRGVKVDASGRLPLWREAWEMSLRNFPFGMGSQSWLTHDIITDAYRVSKQISHPHNMYLMWAAEYGWVSIFGLLIVAWVALKRLWKRRAEVILGNHPNAVVLAGFTGSVCAALIHASVSAVFIAPASMLVGLMVLSIFWALTQPITTQGTGGQRYLGMRSPLVIRLVFAIAVIAGGIFWVSEVWRYHQAMIDDQSYYQEQINFGRLPRFWFHGYFPRHHNLMPSGISPSD